MAASTEQIHWQHLKMGDREAFMFLYESHYQALFAFGCRVIADRELVKDTIHELFCELWDRRSRLPEVDNVKAYLFTSLKRKLLRENQDVFASLSDTTAGPVERSYEETLVEMQSDDDNKRRVQHLLSKLTPGQLEMIRLKYYEQLSYEAIAQRLQLQPRTVYNQVSEALKTLRKHMQVLSSLFLFIFVR
ncbi:sigma-70 family RNA polymerase sigma factor [Siphonobacter sp. SORGH_AS_0500]|uniref:RNA polymerase sigma factor n=1 Tax=Siphonobacter sp. SORGH_AS_0500 TaxID=1864824 RepID=UPI00285CBD2F|nr:sigma-70 family RNA polymerase sigma factor [Siphonobacter sp. SORGH_AS_0500]MDR6197479.1 RNA polymerase sigma factor (sigma-70 family) [Siphonobacter sp. SORGH_AS_0500]